MEDSPEVGSSGDESRAEQEALLPEHPYQSAGIANDEVAAPFLLTDDQTDSKPDEPSHEDDNLVWLRPYEAAAVLNSYQKRRDEAIRHDGELLGWARFLPINSQEARAHKANVRVERIGSDGPEALCWVCRPEAKAVIDAATRRRDTSWEDLHTGREGVVRYFPPASPGALCNRSVTALARGSGIPVSGVGTPVAGAGERRAADHSAPEDNEVPAPAQRQAAAREGAAPSTRRQAPSPDLVEHSFHLAMVRVLARARDEANYNSTQLLKMVADRGGLGAARHLLHNPALSDGFTTLWERGRVDLTVESLVLQEQYQSLFTEDELAVARGRVEATSAAG